MKLAILALLVFGAACSSNPSSGPTTGAPASEPKTAATLTDAAALCQSIRDGYGGDVAKFLDDYLIGVVVSALPAPTVNPADRGRFAAEAIQSTCPEYNEAAKAWAQSKR